MANFSSNLAVAKRLKQLQEQFPDRIGAALRQEVEIEATECKKHCPVDTGALRATIEASGPEREGRTVRCTISAGGPAAEYALTVHEDLEAFHRVGEAKYIERPLAESAAHMRERLAKRLSLDGVV